MVSKRELQNEINELKTNVSVLKEEYVKNKMEKKMEELGLRYERVGEYSWVEYCLIKNDIIITGFNSITEMYDYIIDHEALLKMILNKKEIKKNKSKSKSKKVLSTKKSK